MEWGEIIRRWEGNIKKIVLGLERKEEKGENKDWKKKRKGVVGGWGKEKIEEWVFKVEKE